MRGQRRLRAFDGRWPSRNRPGGHGPDSGVPRHQYGRKPSREPWESAHEDLVGRQIRRRDDGIVVNEFYVGQMQVPIVSSLVHDHSQHLGHGVVYPLNTPVTAGMIRACSNLVHTQQLIIYSL